MQPPIRIKQYGLFSITRRGYIAQLVFMVVLLVLLLIAWGRLEAAKIPPGLPPPYLRLIAFLRWLPWIVLGFAVLIATEAFFVFRRFAREEAKRRAEESPKPTQP